MWWIGFVLLVAHGIAAKPAPPPMEEYSYSYTYSYYYYDSSNVGNVCMDPASNWNCPVVTGLEKWPAPKGDSAVFVVDLCFCPQPGEVINLHAKIGPSEIAGVAVAGPGAKNLETIFFAGDEVSETCLTNWTGFDQSRICTANAAGCKDFDFACALNAAGKYVATGTKLACQGQTINKSTSSSENATFIMGLRLKPELLNTVDVDCSVRVALTLSKEKADVNLRVGCIGCDDIPDMYNYEEEEEIPTNTPATTEAPNSPIRTTAPSTSTPTTKSPTATNFKAIHQIRFQNGQFVESVHNTDGFKEFMQESISKVLQVPQDLVQIMAVYAGSVVVDFQILSSNVNVNEANMDEIKQIAATNSNLYNLDGSGSTAAPTLSGTDDSATMLIAIVVSVVVGTLVIVAVVVVTIRARRHQAKIKKVNQGTKADPNEEATSDQFEAKTLTQV